MFWRRYNENGWQKAKKRRFLRNQICRSRGFAQRSQTGFCAQLSEKTNPPEHLRRTGVTVLRNEAERADDLVVKTNPLAGVICNTGQRSFEKTKPRPREGCLASPFWATPADGKGARDTLQAWLEELQY